MAYIINIHTATETAIINVAENEKVLQTRINNESKQHATFLHIAMKEILKDADIDIKKINAVAVTYGPGSYTGIRVGIAAAKGLCYALNVPLIFFNSLELMALSAIKFILDADAFYCPMIDARRMEVFTAIYNFNMNEIFSPAALILEKNSFDNYAEKNKVYFLGNGSLKIKNSINLPNAVFSDVDISTKILAKLSSEKFYKKEFENIAYAQPLYLKEFYLHK